MGRYGYGYWEDYAESARVAAVQYIRECLTPMNDKDIYWTVTYSRNDPMSGLWELKLDTLHKLIGIIQHFAFNSVQKGRHGRDRFIPGICAGTYRTKSQRKAAIDSVYHFLYLIKGKSRVDACILHDILRGLPCNRKTFLNCSLPGRRKQVEALLKFVIESLESPYRENLTGYPRGISLGHDGAIIINSEPLVELLWRRPDDADRIIEMFIEDETAVGMLEDRLETHTALDAGVL